MKSLFDLKQFYTAFLAPKLEALEIERLKAVKNIYATCLPVAIVGGLIAVFLLLSGANFNQKNSSRLAAGSNTMLV